MRETRGRPDLRRTPILARSRFEHLLCLLAEALACSVAVGPGCSTFTRICRPFRSFTQPRENAHVALLALYAVTRGAVVEAARSGQDDRTAFAHQRQRLLDRKDRTLHIDVEGSSKCAAVISPS